MTAVKTSLKKEFTLIQMSNVGEFFQEMNSKGLYQSFEKE